MAAFSEISKELMVKIAYLGISGSGKTANFQSLFRQTTPDRRRMMEETTEGSLRTPYFDFLPLTIADYRSQPLRFNLFSIPVSPQWKTLRRQLMQGVDGIIWVVDSRTDRLEENERYLKLMVSELTDLGVNLETLPWVTQLNHRDSSNAAPLQVLRESFGQPSQNHLEAVASRDVGVLETLETLGEDILQRMDAPPKEHPMRIRSYGANDRPSDAPQG